MNLEVTLLVSQNALFRSCTFLYLLLESGEWPLQLPVDPLHDPGVSHPPYERVQP